MWQARQVVFDCQCTSHSSNGRSMPLSMAFAFAVNHSAPAHNLSCYGRSVSYLLCFLGQTTLLLPNVCFLCTYTRQYRRWNVENILPTAMAILCFEQFEVAFERRLVIEPNFCCSATVTSKSNFDGNHWPHKLGITPMDFASYLFWSFGHNSQADKWYTWHSLLKNLIDVSSARIERSKNFTQGC